MKLQKLLRLESGPTANQICELLLFELPLAQERRFVVQTRQGRAGSELRDSVLTPEPVTLAQAEVVFARIEASRRAQGFAEPGEPVTAVSPRAAPAANDDPRTAGLLAGLAAAAWKRKTERERGRWIWLIGQLRIPAAVPRLLELLGSGAPMLDYCLAYALARARDPVAGKALSELQQRGRSEMVRRMAWWAQLELLDETALTAQTQQRQAGWSPDLQQAWGAAVAGDVAQLSRLLASPQAPAWPAAGLVAAWPDLELCTRLQPALRALWFEHLRNCELKPGVFRGWRRLYKLAELRDDWNLLGLLAARIELSAPGFRRRHAKDWAQGKRSDRELIRDDSRLAFSDRTRAYFCRRNWRTLLRLAADQPAHYVALASAILLEFDDASAPQPLSRRRFVNHQGEYRYAYRDYGPYARALSFNQLLFRHSSQLEHSRDGLIWYTRRLETVGKKSGQSQPPPPAETRSEAFPELWEQQPQALVRFLCESRVSAVQQFAVRVLQTQPQFCSQLPVSVWKRLLESSFPQTVQFALSHLQARLRANDDPARRTPLLLALLGCNSGEAARIGLSELARIEPLACDEVPLLLVLITAPQACARQTAAPRFARIAGAQTEVEALSAGLLDWLCTVDPAAPALDAICADLSWWFDAPALATTRLAPYERVSALLLHPAPAVVRLAALWLSKHEQPVSRVPAQLFADLLADPDPVRRSAGVLLFSALPEAMLLEQFELLRSFALSPLAQVRVAVAPALARLAGSGSGIAGDLRDTLVSALFRAESGEGQHQDWLDWLCGPMQGLSRQLDQDQAWRCLCAQSRGAQQLGAWLLPGFAAHSFTISQWSRMARHVLVSVRRFALQAFGSNPARAETELEASLGLCDSEWPEVRAFVCQYLVQAISPQAWDVDRLIQLCDHPAPLIQQLGRELITRNFRIEDLSTYLLKLSQHPSSRVQLFVSNWLVAEVGADLEQLKALRRYFFSVLCAVNRGRLVKNRVLKFLRQHALSSLAHAQLVSAWFAELVVTVVVADKAQYLEALTDLRDAWPQLESPLQRVPLPLRSGRAA